MIKRRSFLQGIAAAVFAGLGIKKAKDTKDCGQHTEFLEMLKREHEANLKHLEGEPVEILQAGAEQEYELGEKRETGFGYNRKIFRYVKNAQPKGNLYQGHGVFGVVHDNEWIQTYGECQVNAVEGDRQLKSLVDLEGR